MTRIKTNVNSCSMFNFRLPLCHGFTVLNNSLAKAIQTEKVQGIFEKTKTSDSTTTMALRRSKRLMGMYPELEPNDSEVCFFCLKDVTIFNKGTVLLSCCKKYVHRHCQVTWEKMYSGRCAHCAQDLERLFSLRKVSRWAVVPTMEKMLEDEIVTSDLQSVSIAM